MKSKIIIIVGFVVAAVAILLFTMKPSDAPVGVASASAGASR